MFKTYKTRDATVMRWGNWTVSKNFKTAFCQWKWLPGNSFDFRSLCFVRLWVWVVNALVHVNTLLPLLLWFPNPNIRIDMICRIKTYTNGFTCCFWHYVQCGTSSVETDFHHMFSNAFHCPAVQHCDIHFVYSSDSFDILFMTIWNTAALILCVMYCRWSKHVWFSSWTCFDFIVTFWPTQDFSYTPTLNNKA